MKGSKHARTWAFLMALTVGSCAWVKLTDAGAGVAVRNADALAGCERLGATTVKTPTVAGVRNERKVIEEVIVMAKNLAAEMGGNAIVASTQLDDGRQKFDVYRCE